VNQKPASNPNSEQSHKSSEGKEVGRQQLAKVRVGWEQKKVEFLKVAEEKVQQGVRRVKRALSASRGK
jgi:hypothetical protein